MNDAGKKPKNPNEGPLIKSKPIRLGIVVAKFNPEITSVMEKEAIRVAKSNNAAISHIVQVPGCFEIPLAVNRMLQLKNIDAVVLLGAIIKGGTGHDELIANAIASELLDSSLDENKPVGLGILGPKITWKQAKDRAKDYANRASLAAISRAKEKI